jgi:phage/plasmid primase-like uncharacterized protein
MMPDAIEQFENAMLDSGLTPPEKIIGDGRIHRFSPDGHPSDRAGWYVLHLDGIPAGAFGDWRTSEQRNWHADIGRRTTQDERMAHRARMTKMRKQREAKETKLHEKAAEKAADLWDSSKPAPDDHQYLKRKNVKSHELRMDDKGNLIVPLNVDFGLSLSSLQIISPNGDKRFLAGGRTKGCFFIIGDGSEAALDRPLCFAEGYATGATIHEATGCDVVVAFNSGNLLPVALYFRESHPDDSFVFCADDDIQTKGNPGLTKATEVARAVGGVVARPDFGADRPEGASDFNDMAALLGLGAVKAAIENAIENAQESAPDLSRNRRRPGTDTPAPDESQTTTEDDKEADEERKAIQEEADEDGPRPDGQDGVAHVQIGIDVTFQHLVGQTKLAWKALLEANKTPFLFRRGTIVRIERTEAGALIAREVTPDRMRYALARAAYWYKPAEGKKPERHAFPPMPIVRNVLATPNPPLPALRRIIEVPVFAADGRLYMTPGYNPASELYYQPPRGFRIPQVPASPNKQNIANARELILEMIRDFPFVGDAERAHAIAALLLPFVRQLIDGPTPLHLFEKPSPGTGATLLIQALAYVSIGRDPAMMTEGRDEDEWRKRITSKMAAGHAFILIDNLRRRLDSAALSSAITATTWEDRRLGATEIISFPVNCTWLSSGNNPALSLEMARRSIRIRLDAKVDRPWLRESFTHSDLLTWVANERAHLIWSALVLAQAWIANGRPSSSGKRLGMFEKWSDVIGGILHVAGIPGFLGNLDAFYEDSDWEGAEWRNFIAAWSEKWGEVEVTVSNIFDLADSLELGSGNERSRKTKLGKLLADNKDRQFGACRLKKGSAVDGSQRWKLEPCK